jgi:hypothetical protein
VFQLDFLNDDCKKLPKALKDIIEDKEKRKKLIVYINPPYAEHGSTILKKHKTGVSMGNVVLKDYESSFGSSSRELYAQFIIRICMKISGCKIGMFSKLKHIQANNFKQFRKSFKANFLKGFIVPANTFDNVKGNFPIAFQIWDSKKEGDYNNIKVDIIDKDSNYLGEKSVINTDNNLPITKWIKKYENQSVKRQKDKIGLLNGGRTDFQNQNLVFLVNIDHPIPDLAGYYHVYKDNVIPTCIYISVRKCIKADWTNDRDQFLFPNKKWEKDTDFKNNCLIYTLFHDSNNIRSKEGTNHWIPFTEKEVKAKGKFESHFMSDFIAGKAKIKKDKELFDNDDDQEKGKLVLSKEAQEVFNAGKEIWKYYHSFSRVNVNASFYDIKLHFQESTNGRMNNKSTDEEYNVLIGTLRDKLKILAKKIEPKIYKYGFLLK